MKAQAGTRCIGSFLQASEHGQSRITSHYGSFQEFAARIAQAVQSFDILEPVYNGKPCMDDLSKLWSR